MKKLLSALIFFTLLSGCEQDPIGNLKKGFVQLTFSPNELGKTMETDEPAFVLLSIEDNNGNSIELNKKLPLYSFGNTYVSEGLQLTTGSYKLTQFMILDDNNNVIYATPLEGSELADLVDDPLPINFTITENESTLLTPEVLEVTEESIPESFGYVSFGFEVVETPENIIVNFLMPPLPYFVTNGYDSVVITLSSAGKQIIKRLDIISPIEAVGDILGSEITSSGAWTLTVKAYHEIIDEVPHNFHVNESITTLNVTLDNNVDKIEVRESMLRVIKNGAGEANSISWNHKAHLMDETGFFHFVLDNDFCAPDFEYDILKSNVAYLLYYKSWHYNNPPSSVEYLVAEYYGVPEFIAEGSYTDNDTFEGINCDLVNPGVLNDPSNQVQSPHFYFFILSDDTLVDCFVVWQSLNDPHDPLKGGRSTDNPSSEGYFRMSSSGIEKHRAEAYKRMKK